MARLPTPGFDNGAWGDILNEYLRVSHNEDGTLKVEPIPADEKGAAGGVAELDLAGLVPSGQLATGTADTSSYLRGDGTWQQVNKSTVGLSQVDNTSDASKPVSTATQAALDGKVAKGGDTMTGGLTVGASASTTVPQVTIAPSTSVSGASLLRFLLDRSWEFQQHATGAGTALQLASLSSDKYFRILNSGGAYNTLSVYVSTTTTSNAVGIGLDPTPGSGRLQFGAGTTAADGIRFGTDTNLYRSAADTLKTDDNLQVAGYVQSVRPSGAPDTAASYQISVGGTDAVARFVTFLSGKFEWGDGTNARDTNLYRSAADTLKTDDAFIAGAGITPRVNTLVVSGSTYTPAINTTDLAIINTPSADFTVANPTGTPVDGQKLTLRIKSGATGYIPTWGSGYQSSGLCVLPNYAQPASKTVTLGFTYDAAAAKWVLLAFDMVGY